MSKFNKVTVLTTSALLVALAVVLGFFKIPVNQFIEIRFGILPIALSAVLFGPVVGGIVGAVSDIGGYFAKPTGPFFPGFTVSALLAGVIFGIVLYNRTVKVWNLLLAVLIHSVVVGLFLNTLWLSILYGSSFSVLFIPRLFKEAIMLPINTAILFLVLRPLTSVARGRLGIEKAA